MKSSRPDANGLAGAATTAAALLAGLLASPAAAASAGDKVVARALPQASAAGWSAERMERAEPIELRSDPRRTAGAAGAPVKFGSKELSNTESYPNRVHGRLFGTFGLLGDFSCSATVLSSGSGSLISTAGHCIFDAGGTNRFATSLTFVPGYRDGTAPFGRWPATHVATTSQWAFAGDLDFDVAMARLGTDGAGRSVQEVVGSRGVGFGTPRPPRLAAYGYPAAPAPFDGERLIRCHSRSIDAPTGSSLGMGCDMQQGSSGGGWVAQKAFVVSNTSHGRRGWAKTFFGPRYGRAVKNLYGADARAYPSTGPIRCRGRIASIIGTDRAETIRGSRGRDVIATLDGDDRVRSRGGKDIVCLGSGDDVVAAGGARDRIDGGRGRDRCHGGGGRDSASRCERESGIP